MLKRVIGQILVRLIRIGLAVFFAAGTVHWLLGTMQVQADVDVLPFVPLLSQASIPMTSQWSTGCVSQKTVIMGTGLGSENQLINPQTLLLKNEGELDNIQAQVAGIVTNEPLPRAVVFSTDVHESVTVTDYLINEVAYYFTSSLTPASVITSEIVYPNLEHQTAVPSPQSGLPPKGSGPRGLVIYGQMDTSEHWYSAGHLTLASVSSQREVTDSAEELINFAPLTAATDLMVTAVFIDNDADERAITIEAASGGVFTSISETGPTHGNLLNITTFTLTAVPTGTSRLSLTINSPPSPTGDSATLIGLNLNYRCEGSIHDVADLVVGQVALPPQVTVNTPIQFTVNITNSSLVTATNIVVTNILQAHTMLLPNSPKLDCSIGDDPSTCYLSELGPGAIGAFDFWLTPTTKGVVTYVVMATSDQPDPTMPNIATQTVEVVDHHLYLPITLKPSSLAITVTHSQNPAYNQIPYYYEISITNTGDRKIPNVLIQDNFDQRLFVEHVTPPQGCSGSVDLFGDFIVSCDSGLAVGSTLTFTIRVRPKVNTPETIQANIKVSSVEPGFYFKYTSQITPTKIDLCLHNKPGLGNAYTPLLFGETYCGQVQAQKYAKYYFTFTLPRPGRVVAILRPAQVEVPWIPSDVNYPALSQLAFTTTTGTESLAWCCNVRTGKILTEFTYTEAGEHLLMIKSLETFEFSYRLSLEYYPSGIINNAMSSLDVDDKEFSDMRFQGSISKNRDISVRGKTTVLFVCFISGAFGLIYRRKH